MKRRKQYDKEKKASLVQREVARRAGGIVIFKILQASRGQSECHCEPARRLVWQSPENWEISAFLIINVRKSGRFPHQSSAAATCRAQPPKVAFSAELCALTRNDRLFRQSQTPRLFGLGVVLWLIHQFPDTGNEKQSTEQLFQYFHIQPGAEKRADSRCDTASDNSR